MLSYQSDTDVYKFESILSNNDGRYLYHRIFKQTLLAIAYVSPPISKKNLPKLQIIKRCYQYGTHIF